MQFDRVPVVESGLKAAGYDHVMIDDCWMAKARDPKTSRLVADPVRFPSGIKTLAAKIHKLGLKACHVGRVTRLAD